jgi:integrase/recombinase XerD
MPLLPLEVLAEVFPGIVDLPGRLAPRSLVEYRYDVQHYLAYCGYSRARALDPHTLRAWRQHQVTTTGLSPNTITRRVRAVQCLVRASAKRAALDPAVAFRFLEVESVPEAPLRTRLRPRQPLTPAQVRAVCTAPDPHTLVGLRDRALLFALATSGCRVSELLTVTGQDLVGAPGAWFLQVLGKGQAHVRRTPLSQEASIWLQLWLRKRKAAGLDVPLVFTSFTGRPAQLRAQPLSRTRAWQRVKGYGAQCGLSWLSPRDFRRFVATQVAERHGMRQAQLTLGHRLLQTTTLHYLLDELVGGLTEQLF